MPWGQDLQPIEVLQRHTVCTFPDCGKTPLSKGWCPGHYNQHWQGREMGPLRLVDPGRGCAVPGCEDPHYARELCRVWGLRGFLPGPLPGRPP